MSGMAEKAKNIAMREKIQALEDELMQMDQVSLRTEHYFAHGTYTRELHIPAGVMLTGAVHLNSTINILSAGKMRIVTSDGYQDIEAPLTFVSGPREKKAGIALEDSIFINVFPWNGEDDLQTVIKKVSVPNFEALERRLK